MQTGTRTAGAFDKWFWDLHFTFILAKTASTCQEHSLRQQRGKGSTPQSVSPILYIPEVYCPTSISYAHVNHLSSLLNSV